MVKNQGSTVMSLWTLEAANMTRGRALNRKHSWLFGEKILAYLAFLLAWVFFIAASNWSQKPSSSYKTNNLNSGFQDSAIGF